MIQVKPVWNSLNVQLALKRPIFEWTSISGRFCTMIYNALSEKVPINSKEFSVVPANQLSELKAKYAVYGGASTITLTPDTLELDFPTLVAADAELVQNIIMLLHDAFPKAFPELTYNTVNVRSLRHLEFTSAKDNPADYLAQFVLPNPPKDLDGGPFIFHPGAKCEIIAKDQSWKCALSVERSIPNARAVFVAINFSMNRVDPSAPYKVKAELAEAIVSKCHQILGLETSNVAG